MRISDWSSDVCSSDLPEKRAVYDRVGHEAFAAAGANGGGSRGGFDFGFGSSFADIFDEMFGEMRGGRRAQGVQRGADLRYNMTISLDVAFKCRQSTIKVPTSVGCDACSGTGAEGDRKSTRLQSSH